MKFAVRAALPVLGVVLLATAVVAICGLTTDQTGIFPVTGVLVAVVALLAWHGLQRESARSNAVGP